MRFSYEDLEKRYAEMTCSVICKCEAATPLVGGMPAGKAGIRAFISHHLGITDEVEAQKAFDRIMTEEMGDKPVPSETGELNERLTYGINQIRRTAIGPYFGNWMFHANLKTSMSRLGMFSEMKGTKGNVAEAGAIYPHGISKLDNSPECIYLVAPDGTPATTYYEEFRGRVSSPKGSMSIIHHSECVPAGTQFEYEFKFIKGKMKESDIKDMLALSMIVGMGSVKSLGHGKFRILDAEILNPIGERKKAPKVETAVEAI